MDLAFKILAALLVGHALCDFPLQGDFLSRAKDPNFLLRELACNGQRGGASVPPWRWCMGAHCAIHAGWVWLVTGSLLLGLAEFFAHWAIDVAKCRRRITFGQDQMLHVICKVAWAPLAVLL